MGRTLEQFEILKILPSRIIWFFGSFDVKDSAIRRPMPTMLARKPPYNITKLHQKAGG